MVALEDEVENMFNEEHVREAGEEERLRLINEFSAGEQNVRDDALRVFEACMVCKNREADQQITCCLQFLCLPVKNKFLTKCHQFSSKGGCSAL